jgi:hypothetical protein
MLSRYTVTVTAFKFTIITVTLRQATVGEVGHFNPPPVLHPPTRRGARENVPLSNPFRDTLGGHTADLITDNEVSPNLISSRLGIIHRTVVFV